MRDFFINTCEKLIAVFLVLALIGVVIAAGATMMDPMMGGFFKGLLVLIVGIIAVILYGGILYVMFGIHDNTKRTAEALENRD